MTLRRPDAALTIDGDRCTAAQAAVTALQVELGVGTAHDRFRAAVAAISRFADVAAGATASVELGYGDDLSSVLTGSVTAVERRPWGVVVEGLASTFALSRARVGKSYVSQTAGDIVTDLVAAANGTVGDVSSPLSLSAYHADERRTVWTHLVVLARLAGCELSAEGDGSVNFRPPKAGAPDHTFRHGAELVRWDVGPRDSTGADVGVVPFGAASEQGSDKWHVLLREPDGGAPSQETLVPGALRDRDSAQTYEQALKDARTRRGTGGELLIGGDESVRAGDVAALQDVPGDGGDPLRVVAVQHRLDGEHGFLTTLRVEGVAA